MRIFGRLLLDRRIWALNRRSVARAGACGLFLAFVPLPAQMVMAAACAIMLGFNLPVAVAMVWITNPLTIPVMFYGAYRLGAWVLGLPPQEFDFEMTFSWIAEQVGGIWAPLLLGSFICGVTAAIVGFTAIHVLWRLHVLRSWQERRARKRAER